ncbi:LPS assembly protein LptD [Francisella sp. Scap27]|uniref:LPS-assembly protein LptD n=1 Tax=Francisella sp. Scap27 TaxID=2589986 RepID=UPI0015B811A2|nr:LPS assembly protein LptD [Francisella sp. Scap27]QLE79809.1 LPS assembly protein LptD [Francisella sp. Scap27]
MIKKLHTYLLVSLGTICFSTQAYAARIMEKNLTKEDWQCKVIDGKWSCERPEKPKNVFDKKLKTPEREKALADDLGWVKDVSTFVGGYYNNDSQFTKALCESKKTDLSYQNGEYDTDGTFVASGNVEVLQCDQELYGDNAIVDFNTDKSSIRSLVMTGDVISRQPSTGIVLRTKEFDSNLNDNTYSTGNIYFRMPSQTPNTRIYDKDHYSGYLRGYANSMKKEDADNLIFNDAYITSGGPYDNDWKISGENIDIDTKEEMAYVKNGFFKIKDIPVLYIPYLSHPINDKRRSGFLMPQYANTEGAGFGVTLPYYFNLAPNYDLLLSTTIWSKSGIMESANFRYMTDYFEGEFDGSILPIDFQQGKMRGAFSYTNTGNFKNGITTNLRYDYVSDKDFYDDFSVGDVNLVTKTLLDRQFDVNYGNSNIDSSLTLLDYGVVNPDLNLANRPYAKLPEFKFDANADGYTSDSLSLSIETLNTYFYKEASIIDNNPDVVPKVGTNINGFRSYEAPKVQGNFSDTWGFINPSLQVPVRYYQLQSRNTDTIKFNKGNVTSVLPIFNIDAGAYFDRDYATKDGSYTQTLEPRLFYTYIPYQNQSDIPLFDTGLQNEQYMQMFQVNRFTGHDRINNANQVTYALESTTVNQEDGSTIVSAKIGQQLFLADRNVTLCQGNSGCSNTDLMDPYSDNSFSPIMGSFEFQVIKNIYFSAQANYRMQTGKVDYQVYQLSYKDDNENIFNVSYDNIANNWNGMTQEQINEGQLPRPQETVTLSTILNITDHWGVAALWNYNFIQNQTADVFGGVQYDAKSWTIRALIQASAFTNATPNDPDALDPLTTSYILEFELKGLGGVGDTSNLSNRLNQINGYTSGQWGAGT